MSVLRPTALFVLAVFAVQQADATQKRKKKKGEDELPNQTLELPKDPPNAVVAETARLVFHVSNLSAKGLLSQQVRDALKDLNRQLSGAQPVKLRAFVAGTGDLRRVPAIVSETFTEKRLPIPAVSVVQVGALPLEGAQVVIESVSTARKAVNPQGVAFFSGQQVTEKKPFEPAAPLAAKSLAQLKTAVSAAAVDASDVLRVTCFLTGLDGLDKTRADFRQAFPRAAFDFVQVQRAAPQTLAECEAVGRLRSQPEGPVRMLNPAGLPSSPNYSQVALTAAKRLAFSGTQLAFGYEEKDVRLAFDRLGKSLEEVRAPIRDTVYSYVYPLTSGVADRIRALRFGYFDKSRPPASTLLLFEGLQSGDASFGIDVIVAMPEP